MVGRISPETETLADKFERCDHVAFYFSDAEDEPMRREVLTGDEYDLIVAALRKPELAQCPDHAELIARLRGRALFLRNKGGVKSPDLMEQAARALQGPDTSTDREGK